jgi:flagellar protein FlaG
MVDLVSMARPASAQDSRIVALASSYADNNTDDSNNSNVETRQSGNNERVVESSKESVERTIQALKNYIESDKRSLDFTVHKGTGDIMIKVVSQKDGKVIREIPSEKMLDLVAKMEELAGTLFNENA